MKPLSSKFNLLSYVQNTLPKGQVSKTLSSLFFTVIVFALAIQPNESIETESCHLRELELCVVGAVSIVQNPNGIPVTEAEIKRHCEITRESCDCFHSYMDRCLTPLQASMADFLTRDIVKLEKEFCDNNGTDFRADYMKHAACLRGVQKKYQRTCMKDFQVGFEGIHKLDNKMRASTACCNANRLKDCIMPRIEDECGSNAQDFVNNLLTRTIGSIFTVTCRIYDPMGDSCAELLPPIGTEPHVGRNTSAISRLLSSYMRL